MSSPINVVFLNIGSLFGKLSSLEYFLGTLQQNVDIVVLNETWLLPGEENFFNIPGYVAHHQVRNTRKTRGGGLVIFIANHIQTGTVFGEIQNEVQFLGVSLPQLNVSIVTYYRPPDPQNLPQFFARLEFYLDKYKKSLFLCDSNLDLFKQENCHVTTYTTTISSCLFKILNEVTHINATRVTSHSRTLLDHGITDLLPFYTITLSTKESYISDHKFLAISLLARKDDSIQTSKTYTFTNYEAISQRLSDIPHAGSDFDIFHGKLCELVSQNTISKTVSTKKSNNDQPWFKSSLKPIRKLLRKFSDLKRDFPTNEDFRKEYYRIRIDYRNQVQATKNSYYATLFQSNLQDSSKLWKIANQVMHNKPSQPSSSPIFLKTQAGFIQDQFSVANQLNSHFTSITNHNNNDSINSTNSHQNHIPNITEYLDKFTPTTEEEVETVIQSLPNNSSPGYDRIPAKFLKDNRNFFTPFLTSVANHIFETGHFPDSLKYAIVTAIFKSGDKQDPANYRPISVVSVFSKFFELLIKSRLLTHLSLNNFISNRQYGFLKNRSTTSAAVSLLNSIIHSLNEKFKTACLFLDLSKAFDRMKYSTLNHILYSYGIRGLALTLIMSFLTNRTQSVKLGSLLSDVLSVLGGLPQGSCLVLLFLIYINGLLYLRLHGTSQSFCDDTVLSYRSENYESLQFQMAQDLDKISSFLESLNMSLNISKTKFIIFKTKNSPTHGMFDGFLHKGQLVERVDVYDYLGLLIDSKLSFQHHASRVIQRTAPYAGLLRRLSPILPKFMLWQIYFSHIHSRLTYLLPVWAGVNQHNTLNIQRIQNKAVKNILKLPLLTSTSTLYSPKCLPFTKMAEYESVLLIYKIINNLTFVDSHITSNIAVTNRNTRQSGNLRPPNFVLSLAQNTIFYRGINQYNVFIQNNNGEPLTAVGQLKTRLKNYIFHRS